MKSLVKAYTRTLEEPPPSVNAETLVASYRELEGLSTGEPHCEVLLCEAVDSLIGTTLAPGPHSALEIIKALQETGFVTSIHTSCDPPVFLIKSPEEFYWEALRKASTSKRSQK